MSYYSQAPQQGGDWQGQAPAPAMGGPPPGMGGYGAPPPAAGGYGAPPPAMGGYGAPPPAYGAPPPAYAAGPPAPSRPLKPGEWACPCCYVPNAQFMERCEQCHNPKPMDLPLFGGRAPHHGGGGGGGMRPYNTPPKVGDWICPDCSNNNFQWRESCNKCGKARPPNAAVVGSEFGPVGSTQPGVQPKPGDWVCPSCNNNNFAARTACNRCGVSKPENAALVGTQLAAVASSQQNVPTKPGDWICADAACANINFQWRTECHKCGKPKPEDAQVVGQGSSLPAHVQPGDWICSDCGNTNFSFRTECNKCSKPRPDDAQIVAAPGGGGDTYGAGGGGGGGGGSTAAPVSGARPGDWICATCSNNNFAWRTECKQCGKPRTAEAQTVGLGRVPITGATAAAAAEPQYGGGGGYGGGGAGGYNQQPYEYGAGGYGDYQQQYGGYGGYDAGQYGGYGGGGYGGYGGAPAGPAVVQPGRVQPGVVPRAGDWVCTSCCNTNFAHREACHKCGLPRSDEAPTVGNDGVVPAVVAPMGGGGMGGGGGGGQGGPWREGDWACDKCQNHNFSYRDSCNKCGAPRAGSGGMGGRGGGGNNQPMREGDWLCSSCGNHCFAWRDACNRCNAPKGAGRGGGDRARSRSRSPLR